MHAPAAECGRILCEREAAVLGLAQDFVRAWAGTPRQRDLLGRALAGLREATAALDQPPPHIHLAPLTYAGLWGEDGPARDLAAATTLLVAGLDLLDGLAGGGLPARWSACPRGEIARTASNLLCALPQLAIAALDAPPAVRATLQVTLAGGLLRGAAGTSGEEPATFAALGAILAGASPRVVAACRELGRALGSGGRLAAEYRDLFDTAWSKNLASGIRPFPIPQHLARLREDDRAAFLALLDRARTDGEAQAAVRARLLAAGEPGRSASMVEAHGQRALRALADAGLLEPARGQLRALIAGISTGRAGAGAP